jgi:hypothetical protein
LWFICNLKNFHGLNSFPQREKTKDSELGLFLKVAYRPPAPSHPLSAPRGLFSISHTPLSLSRQYLLYSFDVAGPSTGPGTPWVFKNKD